MHRPGVVGDQQVHAAQGLDHPGQRNPPRQVQAACGMGLGDRLSQGTIVTAPEDRDPVSGVRLRQQPHQFGEPGHRPAFVVPAGTRLESDPAVQRQLGKVPTQLLGGRSPTRDPFPPGPQRHAQVSQQRPLPVHGVGLRRGSRHRFPMEHRGQLPPVAHADKPGPAAGPTEHGRARQPLEIQDPVIALGAELAHQTHHRGPMTRLAPVFPVEGDQAPHIRIPLQQRHQAAQDPPIDPGLRELQPQQSQHGQRVDHVSQGTGLENEDLHGTNHGTDETT